MMWCLTVKLSQVGSPGRPLSDPPGKIFWLKML